MQNKNNEQYISLAEAARYTTYSPAYLKLRVNQGRLKARKVDGKWYTRKEWIDEYLACHSSKEQARKSEAVPEAVKIEHEQPINEPTTNRQAGDFITLAEAANITPYSARYLQLLAKGGKLRAKEENGEWYTTLAWVEDYLLWLSKKLETVEAREKSFKFQVTSFKTEEEKVFTAQPQTVAPVSFRAPRAYSGQAPQVAVEESLIQETPAVQGISPLVPQDAGLGRDDNENVKIKLPSFKLPKFHFPIIKLPRLPRPSFRFSFSWERALGGVMVVILLFFATSFYSPAVRASFMDWSREMASSAKKLSLSIASTTKQVAYQVKDTTEQGIFITQKTATLIWHDYGSPAYQQTKKLAQDASNQALATTRELASETSTQVSAAAKELSVYISPIADKAASNLISNLLTVQDKSVALVSDLTDKAIVMLEGVRNRTTDSIHLLAKRIDSIHYRPSGSSVQNDKPTAPTRGFVLGESTDRLAVSDQPLSQTTRSLGEGRPNFLSQSASAFSQSFRGILNFLNPSSPDSLLSRLSGTVSEIGSAIGGQADPLTKAVSQVTTFFSQINPGKILQPAGSFIARLKPSTPAVTEAPVASTADEAVVSGELALQPAATLTPSDSPEIAANLNQPKTTTTPTPIRYVAPRPVTNNPSTSAGRQLPVTTPSPTLTVSTPSGYFSLTNDGLLTTAKTIHTLSSLISDIALSSPSLTVTDNANIKKLTIASTLSAPEATFDKLTVANNATIKDLIVTGSFNPQSLTTSSLTALSITTNTISTKSLVSTGPVSGSSITGTYGSFSSLSAKELTIGGNSSDTISLKGTTTILAPLTVSGAATLSSTLTLTGAATLSSTLALIGAASLSSTLNVGGASTLASLTVSGTTSLTGSLTTQATSTASAFVASSATATSTLAGNLQVNGNTNITGTLTAVEAFSTLATTTISKLAVTSTIATSTFAYNIGSASGNFTLQSDGTANNILMQPYGGKVGIATTTPGATFAVTGNSLFDGNLSVFGLLTTNYLTATSTTATSTIVAGFAVGTNQFVVDRVTGRVGIGTSTPGQLFAVAGNALFDGSITAYNGFIGSTLTATSSLSVQGTTATSTFATGGLAVGTDQFVVQQTSGKVGIGTSTPAYLFHIASATANPQMAVAYDQTNYYTTNVSSTGQITFQRYGSALANGFTFNDTLNVSTSTTETILTVNSTNTSNATTTLAVYQAGTGRGLYINRPNTSQTLATPLVEFVTATSSALSLTSQSGSATSTLSVYQHGANGPIVLFTDTNASTTPAFQIAAITRDIEVREDYVQRSHSDLTTLANINDVFVYDTTKDSDGGAWTKNSQAQASSWYNETLDHTAQSCSISSDDRCGRKEFPEKAILVTTTTDLFIFDAKDNSQWMNFDQGLNGTNETFLQEVSYPVSSVYAFNGMLWVGTSNGMTWIDFIKDKAGLRHSATDYYWQQGGISNRNTTVTEGTSSGSLIRLVNSVVNDIHAAVICDSATRSSDRGCATYVAVATNGGVSVINETDGTVANIIASAGQDMDSVQLTSKGVVYFIVSSTTSFLDSYDILGQFGAQYTTSRLNYYRSDTTPAAFTSVKTDGQLTDLFVTEGTSFIDGTSNTIYLSHAEGLTKLSEKKGDESNSAVKFYQTATTTEEMVGDIRGMWPMNGTTGSVITNSTTIPDASVKANNLTSADGADSSMTYVTGIRGTGIDIADADDYLTITDATDFSFTQGSGKATFGGWFKLDSITTGYDILVQVRDSGGMNSGFYRDLTSANLMILADGTNFDSGYDFIANQWTNVVITYDGPNDVVKTYIDGEFKDEEPGRNFGTDDGGGVLSFGRTNDSINSNSFVFDEPFVTAEALTPSQIKYMYEVGKRALQNHTSGKITGISGADSYQQLYGTSNTVKSISVDLDNNLMYVGTNDGSNGGGVSAIGLQSDTIEDIWGSDALKTDDDGTAWNDDDIVSLSVSGRYPRTLVIGTAAELWLETEQFSLDKYRSQTVNPHGEHLVQTALTIKEDLVIGNRLLVTGNVAGASVEKPTFQVAQDGTVTVRDDILFTGRTTLTSLSNINDVFVYDTSKDSDGGEWTCNDMARATSWYNEPLNTSTRGKTRCFPRKAIVVGANANLYIFDAKDNSEWMQFDAGGTWSSSTNLLASTAGRTSGVFALNGRVYGSNTNFGLIIVDFKKDGGEERSADSEDYKGNIAERNGSKGHTDIGILDLVNSIGNDVSAAVVNDKTYVAVATDGGVSVMNETDGTVINIVRTVDLGGITEEGVVLLPSGSLYASWDWTGSQTNGLSAYYNIQNLTTSESSSFAQYRNKFYNQGGSTPSLIGPTTSKFGSLFATQGTSAIDSSSNTIYVGTDAGITVIQEKQGDETNSSVKYYTKDYISEEMVGDIRGMWPMEGNIGGLQDVHASTTPATLTNNGSATFTSAGVRGHAASFNGSSQYLTASDAGMPSGSIVRTVGVWVKPAAVDGAIHMIFDYGTNVANQLWELFQNSTNQYGVSEGSGAVLGGTPQVGQWDHVVSSYDGTTTRLFVNGVQVASGSLTPNIVLSGSLYIGRYLTALYYYNGLIDEPFITAETLTPAQIKRMYETGKRALEGGVEGTADDTTSAHSAFRIGVGAGAVKYSAGQFIGSIIQVYDGPGSATSTRFITQTASSTSDYYVQFSPDHSATIADNDTFSIGPNALQGDSNRVTALAVDDTRDFIYIGSTSGTGTGGMVTKIALDSDTVTDVWHPSVGKTDDASQPYNTASTTAISYAGRTLVVGANDTGSGGLWSEYEAETLEHKSNNKITLTVKDTVQTARIVVTGELQINYGKIVVINSKNSLFGTSADGPVNITDVDINATTLAQAAAVTLTSNRTLRSTASTTISAAVTVSQQNGQARGSFPTTHGGLGVPEGSIMAALGSKGIRAPIKPGGETASSQGGITQILSGGPITINAAISATGTTQSASDGGGGGGLVVIISKTSIAGSGAINVSGAAGGATATVRGGGGGYSGEPGGNAGYGGSGGGGGSCEGGGNPGGGGAGGSGFVDGKAGGNNVSCSNGGGGGGSLDTAGSNQDGSGGGAGGAGDRILAWYASGLGVGSVRPLTATSATGGNGGGVGGINGGGGGGADVSGIGGAAQSTNPVGSGGGGGGGLTSCGNAGGDGSAGSTVLGAFSSTSPYAGLPGGQGGGGGGGGSTGSNGCSHVGGVGGAGATGFPPIVAGMGAGAGGAGGAGASPPATGTLHGGAGGTGGAGGNGGGAAGMVVMIAPTITYSGTVTGRLVQITGTDALDFIRGYFVD